MMGAEFTNPQKTIFQYTIQLVISIPGGNINTFMDVLADGGHERYTEAIQRSGSRTCNGFSRSIIPHLTTAGPAKRSGGNSMASCSIRPSGGCSRPTENKIDMFEELDRQKFIIIDTNKPMLDDAASAFFGRLFIAMILRASHQRFKNDELSATGVS